MTTPILKKTKYNSRAGKATQVVRVYRTRGTRTCIYFTVFDGEIHSARPPFYNWLPVCGNTGFKEVKDWINRVTGWEAF